jgi:HSP20 family molecular chaperone IbpA
MILIEPYDAILNVHSLSFTMAEGSMKQSGISCFSDIIQQYFDRQEHNMKWEVTCTSEFYYVDIELPGFEASEVKVQFTQGYKMIVQAAKNRASMEMSLTNEKRHEFIVYEDADIKSKNTTAHLSKGILRITLARFKGSENDHVTYINVTED